MKIEKKNSIFYDNKRELILKILVILKNKNYFYFYILQEK